MALWDQLNTKTIKDVASEDIQRQSNSIHLEEENRQALMDVALINKSQLRDGNPIPDQNVIVQTTGDSDRIQFRPEPGEVYRFLGGDILETATGTFSVNFEFRDDSGQIALMGQASSTGQETIPSDNWGMRIPIFIDNAVYMYANVTGGEGRISTVFAKVR